MSTMPGKTPKVIRIFYCYAREDKHLRDELEVHLSSLKRQKLITTWYDREISPGSEWEKEIDTHLSTAHLILLLVSPHFMASEYCYGIEMKKALERHERGTAHVVPIIVRHVDWEDAPFSHLQVLPTDALPIASWKDRDEAFADIAKYIRKIVKELQVSLKTKDGWLNESFVLDHLNRYEEALAAYEQAIRLDPNDALAYRGKGDALYYLARLGEALAAYEQAIRLDPNDALAYRGKGFALFVLLRFEEALAAFEQAIRLDPNDALAYRGKGITFYILERFEEALAAFEQTIRLDPNDALANEYKGYALMKSKRSNRLP